MILLSHVIPSPDSLLGKKLVLFASIQTACLVVGVLLLKTVTVVGLVLIGVSALLRWFVVRPVRKQLRKQGAP
jgi:membrane protein implicated in regulation of membrane protease activity